MECKERKNDADFVVSSLLKKGVSFGNELAEWNRNEIDRNKPDLEHKKVIEIPLAMQE